jgi:hypothetical protein
MENNPNETVETTDAVAPENAPATEGTPAPAEAPENSTSTEQPSTPVEDVTEEKSDYQDLIEKEKKRGKPDPQKARERFEAKRQKEAEEVEDELDEDDKPLTRREARELLERQVHEATVASNTERIVELSEALTDSPDEAEFVREIHKNRIWPSDVPLREQISEARAIALSKRDAAKNVELARKVQSQANASHNTATTHRDPQAATQPNVAGDLAASLQRAGFVFNGQTKQYEKSLPNGKTLVKRTADSQPELVG